MTLSAPTPETSIVIRAFNEERWLPDVFASLHRQRYRDFEVLVVDSGSVDRTRDIASTNGARIVRLRSEDFTFGYSLNIGIEEARGSFIVIISAHAIPTDEEWLTRLIAPLRRSTTAMVFGGQRGHAVSKFPEARDFERIFHSKSMSMDDDHVFVNNANSAIRRDLWERHRFDEGLPGLEDAEWAKYWIPQGFEVIYEPSACVYHVHTESWAQVRHRFHREGIAGRWTAVRIIRHIPREISREVWWGIKDYAIAISQGKFLTLAGEIARYRYNKTIGIVKGILDSRLITNPSKRAELHFDKGFSAVVIESVRSATIQLRSIPKLKPSEVLVRVAYTGVCASDLELFDGRSGQQKISSMRFPIVPGRDISGIVVSLGKKVMDLREGDPVVVQSVQGCGTCEACSHDNVASCSHRRDLGSSGVDGGYAEYLVTRARYALRIPQGLSLREATLAEPLAAVIKGLHRLGAGNGDQERRLCAVLGTNVMSFLSAQTLRIWGHEVVMFATETNGQDWLKGHAETELIDLDRFDWIVEASGNETAFLTALEQGRRGATLLLLAPSYENKNMSIDRVVASDKTIIGSSEYATVDVMEALDVLQRLDSSVILQCTFPLEDFKHAWGEVRTHSHPRVMLHVDPGAD